MFRRRVRGTGAGSGEVALSGWWGSAAATGTGAGAVAVRWPCDGRGSSTFLWVCVPLSCGLGTPYSAPVSWCGLQHVLAPSPGNRRRVMRSGAQWVVGVSGGDGEPTPVRCPCGERRCPGRRRSLGRASTQLLGPGPLPGAGFVVWAPTCVGAESEEPAPGQEKWRSVGDGDERRRRGTGAGS